MSPEEWAAYLDRVDAAWAEHVAHARERTAQRKARNRRRWLRTLVIAPVALALLAGLAGWRYWDREVRQRYTVAIPAMDASPETVVRAWIDAVNARDDATADALSTADGRASIESMKGCGTTRFEDSTVIRDYYYSNGLVYSDEFSPSPTYPPEQLTAHLTKAFALDLGVDVTCSTTGWPFQDPPSHEQDNMLGTLCEVVKDATTGRWRVENFFEPPPSSGTK